MNDLVKETNDLNPERIDKLWEHINNECLSLRILMGGKTGVGKSSVINAVIGDEVSKVAQDGLPCTKKNEDLVWPTDTGDLIITDVPGFGEANSPQINSLDYQENIRRLAKKSHLFILVINCNDKALQLEEEFLSHWHQDDTLNETPLLIVVNQIDKMKPSREWDPSSLNLDDPKTQKEMNIRGYIDYLSAIPVFSRYAYKEHIFPVSAGEIRGDVTFGIKELQAAINRCVPDILSLMIERETRSREEKAKKIVNYYAMAAAGVAVQPVPVLDSFFIAPIQIAMIIQMGRLHKIAITKSVAGGLVSSIGLSFLGNHIFLNLVSFFPVIKQALGPAIAYSLTYTIGLIINELFAEGNLNPSKEELQQLVHKYKSEAKAAKNRYEEGRT